MSDRVVLQVGGTKIEKFCSYRIDADLYMAGDSFNLELAPLALGIKEGSRCQLLVNDRLELTGLIDRIEDGGSCDRNWTHLDGRDLMGLVVDSYVEEYVTLEGITLKALAERLLKKVPFINRSAIEYQGGIAGARANTTTGDGTMFGDEQAKAQVEPGQTVFEVLKDYAMSRGAMFFSLPHGAFVFGRPKAKGRPMFKLTRRRDGRGNNVLDGSRVRDLSQRYSKITVIGQQQGQDQFDTDEINTKAEVTDGEVPFYKPYVTINNNDGQSPAHEARMLLEQQRARGVQFSYRVARHSQNGRNWTINELCELEDEVLNERATYLIYGRTFILDKRDGPTTELRLGLPGVIQ